MILESVSKKDSKWREIALKICGNKMDADDIVQDMYIRLHKYNITTWNYSFIILLLYNAFKDSKKTKFVTINDFESYIKDEGQEVKEGFSDEDLKFLFKTDSLTKEERDLIEMNFNLSSCQIAKNIDENRIKVHRKLIKIRKKVLEKDFEKLYKNRRNKR